jgi:hypothetical protein
MARLVTSSSAKVPASAQAEIIAAGAVRQRTAIVSAVATTATGSDREFLATDTEPQASAQRPDVTGQLGLRRFGTERPRARSHPVKMPVSAGCWAARKEAGRAVSSG